MEFLHHIIDGIVGIVSAWGYTGIFIMMTLESTFFPFPSEVAMIPAGVAAARGEMSLWIAIGVGVLGSLVGAWINYALARTFGRAFLFNAPVVGRFVTQEKMHRVEGFFERHGAISTFIGRLIPIVRQYISFPAGLAKMNPLVFTIYTTLGAAIWMIILTLLGYFLGSNQALIEQYLGQIVIVTIVLLCLIVAGYVFIQKKSQRS